MVESQPSKLLVAGSIPVSRSKTDLVLRKALCTARGEAGPSGKPSWQRSEKDFLLYPRE